MPTKIERDNFSLAIEKKAYQESTSIMEAIMDHCEATGLEPELAGSLINAQLKIKIEEEARVLHLVKKKRGSRLPI